MTGRLPRTPHLFPPCCRLLRHLLPTSLPLGPWVRTPPPRPRFSLLPARPRQSDPAERSRRLPAARGGGRGCNVSRRPRGGAAGGSVSGRVGPWPREVVPGGCSRRLWLPALLPAAADPTYSGTGFSQLPSKLRRDLGGRPSLLCRRRTPELLSWPCQLGEATFLTEFWGRLQRACPVSFAQLGAHARAATASVTNSGRNVHR